MSASTPQLIVGASLFWSVYGTATGWLAVRVPDRWLDHDTRLTRIRGFERDGRAWERTVAIHRWKHRLPDGGDLFRGGRSKRVLPGRDPESLARFALETRRAEWVHWAQIAAAPAFAAIHSVLLGLLMVGCTAALHLPFILTQRYNRARVLRILRRRDVRQPAPRVTSWIGPATTTAPSA